jgi:hypothetical protein
MWIKQRGFGTFTFGLAQQIAKQFESENQPIPVEWLSSLGISATRQE